MIIFFVFVHSAFFIKRARLHYRHRVVVRGPALSFTDGPMAGWEGAVVNYWNQMHREVHEK